MFDVYHAVQSYMNRIFADIVGMKILLVDHDTSGIISLVLSQSKLFELDVFLVDYLENDARQAQRSLNCVCLLRPTSKNFEVIANEIAAPKYANYHLFFTNSVKASFLERVAEADEHEVVKDFQEIFCDYYPLCQSLFSFNEESLRLYSGRNGNKPFIRTVEGLASIFYSCRQRPSIRFSQRSLDCSFFAKELAAHFDMYNDYFSPRQGSLGQQPLLLIVDRDDDPVTPLLTQWTYQAMIHDFFVLRNGRVKLETSTSNTEFVLNCDQDSFYAENALEPIWSVAEKIQSLVQKYQRLTEESTNFETIADMKRFMEDYPEYKRLSASVSKHTTLASELMRLSERAGLRALSQFEQDLITSDKTADAAWREATPILQRSDVSVYHKLRICMLILGQVGISRPLETLNASTGLSDDDIMLLKHFYLTKSGKESLAASSNGAEDDISVANNGLASTMKTWINGGAWPQLKPKLTALTSHVPKLFEWTDLAIKNKLPVTKYPYLAECSPIEKPQEIVVFVLGGATYEEARFVEYLNEIYPSVKVALGSNFVHNARSYIAELVTEWKWNKLKQVQEQATPTFQ